MMTAMLAPCRRWSISITRACFEFEFCGGGLQGLLFALLATGSFDPPRRPFGCEVAPIPGLVRLLGLLLGDVRFNADRREALRGDAERQRSCVTVTPPDRQRATRGDFFDKPVAQELADCLFGAALEIGREFNRALRVLCGGGQQHE